MAWGKIAKANISLEGGSLQTTASEIGVRSSCSSCGSPLLMHYMCMPAFTYIAMGTIDEQSVIGSLPEPYEHIFLQSKASWWKIPEGDALPKYQKFPEEVHRLLDEWIAEQSA